MVVNEAVWEFASGAAVSAGGVGTVDRSCAGGGETDGGVNFAASVALEPGVFVVVVPESAGWTCSLHMCNGKVLPQANWQGQGVPGRSVAPLETNLVEPPVWNIVMSTWGILQHKIRTWSVNKCKSSSYHLSLVPSIDDKTSTICLTIY